MTIDKLAITADIRTTYGRMVTRRDLTEYKERTGVWARWIILDAPRGVLRGTFDLEGFVPSSGGATRVSTPRTPKAAKYVGPVGADAVTDASSLVTATADAALSFSVTKNASANDITTRIQDLVEQASMLARVPTKSKAFVPFGDFDSVRRVIASRVFCPVFITGHSGNGKTFQIEQACAVEAREYIRVNITGETDEDDLIGGFRLKDGETVFELGPVVVAMLRGAVLLLDEVDLAGPKVMCLQPVLEGNPLTIKKLGITISPNPGFTVFATANTKGRGSEDGKYIGTNMLNEAFLERFNFTIEQTFPSVSVEKKILTKTFETFGGEVTPEVSTFFETLAKWADAIRQTFDEDGIEDQISTRRLVHITKTFFIFGDMDKALTLCLNRFDKSVQAKFLDFYAKLNPANVEVITPVAEGDNAVVTPTFQSVDGASTIDVNGPVVPAVPPVADNVPF